MKPLMPRNQVRNLVDERLRLPPFPDAARELHVLLQDPKAGTREAAEALERAPAVGARLLQLANAGYMKLATRLDSIAHMADVLGVRTLHDLALQAALMEQYAHLEGDSEFDIEGQWAHAILTALVARGLARRFHGPSGLRPSEAYVAGILHDAGKLVLLDCLGDTYRDAQREAGDRRRSLEAIEGQRFGFTHVHVGARLVERWNLPRQVVRAICFHHGPSFEIVNNPAVLIVALADQIAYRCSNALGGTVRSRLQSLAARVLHLTPEAFGEVLVEAQKHRALVTADLRLARSGALSVPSAGKNGGGSDRDFPDPAERTKTQVP